ncbi:hypothetical protein UMN179_02317 [Gallibacterium anatis UMN179]|uniref:Uncharacterized protein n=1 Tax=Gallibacterium anatis (strain UMN179) TaxID=1005058 RepID=F4H900_GALAU|nr:hypothetical protein UMN179_02317 [Gallibacterium anatis UMN179]
MKPHLDKVSYSIKCGQIRQPLMWINMGAENCQYFLIYWFPLLMLEND